MSWVKRNPHAGPVPAPAWTADVAVRARDASRCQRGAPDGVDGAWTMRVYETDQDDEVDFFMSNNVTRQSG